MVNVVGQLSIERDRQTDREERKRERERERERERCYIHYVRSILYFPCERHVHIVSEKVNRSSGALRH